MSTAISFNWSLRPSAEETPSNVLSSGVGPKPPDMIRQSIALSRDSFMADDIAQMSSPTIVILFTYPPISVIFLESHFELVFKTNPESSSSPMHSISIIWVTLYHRNGVTVNSIWILEVNYSYFCRLSLQISLRIPNHHKSSKGSICQC